MSLRDQIAQARKSLRSLPPWLRKALQEDTKHLALPAKPKAPECRHCGGPLPCGC